MPSTATGRQQQSWGLGIGACREALTVLTASSVLTLASQPLAVLSAPRPLPPLTDSPLTQPRREPRSVSPAMRGGILVVNGRSQQAQWRRLDDDNRVPRELWLPLEVLQNQLGVSSRSRSDGSLDLEWFGEPLQVEPTQQQSLNDEVAINALPLLQRVGVQLAFDGDQLQLNLAGARLLQVRSAGQNTGRRIVLDLSGPALVRQEGSELLIGISSSSEAQAQLRQLGLAIRTVGADLSLRSSTGQPQRVFTLGTPNRIVIDLPNGAAGAVASAPTPIDPRLQSLLGTAVRWDRISRSGFRINAIRIEPRNGPLRLTPLIPQTGMEGLVTLPQLALQNQALVAINGGYFNRVRQLPLGALKLNGRWMSGPILNRGVAAWSGRDLPRFGRLSLQEWVLDRSGQRLPLLVVNSGFVQRGISRYDEAWGSVYRALSGNETALLLQRGTVRNRYESGQLEQGVPLRPGDTLLVARGGALLPWGEQEPLELVSQPSSPLGSADQVVGGGPLLLQEGRLVLNGVAEGFSPAFLRQGAPRTILASDGLEVWLITVEGESGPGPTLDETARLLLQMGLRDALNLDGGSSTGLVLGGSLQVKGRGVAGRVHNGIGLIPQ